MSVKALKQWVRQNGSKAKRLTPKALLNQTWKPR